MSFSEQTLKMQRTFRPLRGFPKEKKKTFKILTGAPRGNFLTFGGLEAGVRGLDVCLQVAEFRLSVLEGARSRWPAIRKRSGKRNRGTIQTLGSRGSRRACGSCPHENAVFSFPVYLIGRSLSDKNRASCWPPFDIDCGPPTRSSDR